ncbi:MAG: hypothetical protein WBN45_06225, partial [Arenicellales bacterium]
ALRQSSRYSALSLQCSTNQKGLLVDQNPGQKRDWWRLMLKCTHPDYASVIPAQAVIQNL